jgi:hypothetical protein
MIREEVLIALVLINLVVVTYLIAIAIAIFRNR